MQKAILVLCLLVSTASNLFSQKPDSMISLVVDSGYITVELDFALKHPDRVTALVLVGAVVSGYGYSSHMLTRGGRISLAELFSDSRQVIRYFGWEDPYTMFSENTKAKETCLRLFTQFR